MYNIFLLFSPCNLYLFYTYIPTKLHLNLLYEKQHIKKVVLFKSLSSSPTCFDQFLTILREIFIFFTSVTKDKLFRFVVACLLYTPSITGMLPQT